MTSNKLDSIADKFNTLTSKPTNFLKVQSDIKEDVKSFVKSIYDFTKSHESKQSKKSSNALSELIIDDFDEEQIWQQIELQNNERWDEFVWQVADCMSKKNDLQFPVKLVEETKSIQAPVTNNSESEDNQSDENMDEDVSDIVENNFKEHNQSAASNEKRVTISKKSSIVDDEFFKLHDMEKFLLNEEKHEGKQQVLDSDEESIDMFNDLDDEISDEENGGKDVMYSDFFINDNEDEKMLDTRKKSKKQRKVTFADEDPDDSGEEEKESENNEDTNNEDSFAKPQSEIYEKKSDFELRQERLKQTIDRLENKTLGEAPWQLKGEVDATKRPQNSLLQEVVDFDLTSRPPPIITEQTTVTLESIIMQRIKDKAWDDVVRKEKPVEDVLAFRKQEVLDQSKSKLSLAQVYEAEYLKQKHATDDNETENEPQAHKEVREAMDSLFAKLDALSHYHFTPKAAKPDVKIVSNTPAISMEEVAPVAASNAALLAPEEVKAKHKGELMSKNERTDTDKKRERRKKKKMQREKGKTEKVTEVRNTKKGVEANDKSLKTSKAFFQQLNDDTTSMIKKSNDKRKSLKSKGQ